jgi:hypothetical protein
MLYTELEVNNKVYKLRLNTRNTVALEKAIGCNPLAIFGDGDTIPKIQTMVYVLFYSLNQYQHSISLDDAYNIFDEYLMEHSATDFINVIVEIYKASGLIKQVETNESEEIKN